MIPSPKMILGAGVIVAVLGYMTYDLYSDNKKEAQHEATRAALIEATQISQQEASRADAEALRADLEKKRADEAERAAADLKLAQEKINAAFTEFRKRAAEKEAVLDNPKYDKVFNGRLELFVKQANEATEKQLRDLEKILDGN